MAADWADEADFRLETDGRSRRVREASPEEPEKTPTVTRTHQDPPEPLRVEAMWLFLWRDDTTA